MTAPGVIRFYEIDRYIIFYLIFYIQHTASAFEKIIATSLRVEILSRERPTVNTTFTQIFIDTLASSKVARHLICRSREKRDGEEEDDSTWLRLCIWV